MATSPSDYLVVGASTAKVHAEGLTFVAAAKWAAGYHPGLYGVPPLERLEPGAEWRSHPQDTRGIIIRRPKGPNA